SKSIPEARAKEAREFLTEAAKRMTEHDKASLIVFGGEASMETAPTRPFEVGQIASIVPRDHTDISSALRLALAAFPEGVQRRVLLISDGNASRGDAIAEARAAKAAGVRIDVYPVPLDQKRDILCEAVVCPSEVKKNESFDAKVIVRSEEETEATITLFRNGQLVGREPVHLVKGKNAFLFPQKVVDQGMYEYQAVIETGTDKVPENNRASGFSYVQGKPRVLVLAGSDADAQFLVPALKQEIEAVAEGGANVEYRSLANIPQSLAEFQNYDGLVLVNVNAGSFSPAQLQMLESNVHDLGIGLVMVGGDDSFGAGGYLGTPVERALPVTMDLKQREVMPNGALAVVLHTCELSDGRGNYWAKKITQAAVERLSSQDYAGVLDYGGTGGRWGEEWAIPMQLVGTKSGLLQAIAGLSPGDMPSFHTILDMAEKGLKKVNAALKHIIIITDGDPSPPTGNVMANLRAGKVTLSTVLIDAHGGRAGPCYQAMKKL
ncbi:MAG: VWA domain-containing protein, partial [Pedosphaera parvula]|nr:VWA domain-containing protein [Pedosphaera parvula]